MAVAVYKKGEVIFQQGWPYSACMYDIQSGKIGIYLNYGTETERKLTELPANSYFGEMGLLEGEPRSATAVALEDDTWIKVITKESFDEYLQEDTDRVMALLCQMSGRIRDLTDRYMDACRAVAENETALGCNEEKSSWLREHLKKFADAYKAACDSGSCDDGWAGMGGPTGRTAAFAGGRYYAAVLYSKNDKNTKGTEQPMVIKNFAANEIIFKQGDTNSASMYDITAGTVGIYMNYGLESEKLLTKLEAGKYFGEMGLLEGYPRSATAVALADGTQVKVITAETFGDYLKSDHEKTLAIMRQMSQRIRALTDDYMDACRTIAESLEAEQTGKEKTGWLREHLKKFADAYNNACTYTSSVPEDQKFSTTYAPLFYDPTYYPFL